MGDLRLAAATGNRYWSRVNPSLHSICFGGAAKRAVRCDLCLSLTHLTRECALVSDSDPEVGIRLKMLEVALLAFTGNQTATGAVNSLGGPHPLSGSQEWFSGGPKPCRKWNAKRCGYRRSRHPHICNLCGGPPPGGRVSRIPHGPSRRGRALVQAMDPTATHAGGSPQATRRVWAHQRPA